MNAVLGRIGDYLRSLGAAARRNPVRTVAIVRSVLALVLAFWPDLLTEGQQGAIVAVALVWFAVDEGVRAQVTPTAAPVLPAGKRVTTPDGDPARVVPTG
jgi:hypothetical protein